MPLGGLSKHLPPKPHGTREASCSTASTFVARPRERPHPALEPICTGSSFESNLTVRHATAQSSRSSLVENSRWRGSGQPRSARGEHVHKRGARSRAAVCLRAFVQAARRTHVCPHSNYSALLTAGSSRAPVQRQYWLNGLTLELGPCTVSPAPEPYATTLALQLRMNLSGKRKPRSPREETISPPRSPRQRHPCPSPSMSHSH